MSQLFEAKNERQVLICLSALGRAVYTVPGYTGPALGRAAAAGTKGSPKHAVAGGGGLWGKSGGGYSAVGGGVQVEASSRGVKQTSPRRRAPSGGKSPPKPSVPPPQKVAAAAAKPAAAPKSRTVAGSGKPYDGGYSGSDEDKALAWISDATGTALAGPLMDSLKSGVALCELVNVRGCTHPPRAHRPDSSPGACGHRE